MSSIIKEITQQQRQYWMSVLAKAPSNELISLAEPLLDSCHFNEIRPPEIGLTQVRGRMGGTGSQFNIGDVTITRCVMLHKKDFYGHSYVIGRNKKHALIAAKLDALLQDKTSHQAIYQEVIIPLDALIAVKVNSKKEACAETKVDFFTLVRGED